MVNDTGTLRKLLIAAAIILVSMAAAYFFGYHRGYRVGLGNAKTVTLPGKTITLPAEVKTETQTVVKYVPRPAGDTADVAANIGKQQLTVRVNGQEQQIKKSDSEKYVFDQNQLQLNQTSKATVDIRVPVVDKTRRWSAGIGYGNHGIAGKVDYPIGHVVGGWIAGDRKTVMAGISVNF